MRFKPEDQFVLILTKAFRDNAILQFTFKGGREIAEKKVIVVQSRYPLSVNRVCGSGNAGAQRTRGEAQSYTKTFVKLCALLCDPL